MESEAHPREPPSQLPSQLPRQKNFLGRLLLLAALGILVTQFTGKKGPKIGMDLPELTLPRLGGGEETLSAHLGQVVVLDFWATWCPPCVESLPAVHRISREFAASGLVTLAVNRDEGAQRAERVQAFLDRHGLSDLAVVLDDGKAAGALGIRALPTLVVIDRRGQVVGAYVGALDEEKLRSVFLQAVEAPWEDAA